jgi:hypothetical protein
MEGQKQRQRGFQKQTDWQKESATVAWNRGQIEMRRSNQSLYFVDLKDKEHCALTSERLTLD